MIKSDLIVINSDVYIVYDRKIAIKSTFFGAKTYSVEELMSCENAMLYTLDLHLTWQKRKAINEFLSDLIINNSVPFRYRNQWIEFVNLNYYKLFGVELIEHPIACTLSNLLKSPFLIKAKTNSYNSEDI